MKCHVSQRWQAQGLLGEVVSLVYQYICYVFV